MISAYDVAVVVTGKVPYDPLTPMATVRAAAFITAALAVAAGCRAVIVMYRARKIRRQISNHKRDATREETVLLRSLDSDRRTGGWAATAFTLAAVCLAVARSDTLGWF